MKLVIGSDHAAFRLKETLKARLLDAGHDLTDVGTDSEAAVDYPDFAMKLGMAIARGEAERGILLCGSGVGASVAANKIPGVRAGLCHDTYSAHQGVEHDDMNVLVLGARIIGEEVAKELVDTFLRARYSAEERHARRLAKVLDIERAFFSPTQHP
ncbi:MAG: ribose 5-phosphate isomerase B [Verrucomicrobiia bacterium]